MRLHCLYAALVLTLAFASPAFAYLDPGTGSMLVSALVGIVATLFFLLKGIYYKGTGVFYSLVGRTKHREREGIVFWSEGRSYWNSFRPVMEALSARGERCTYLSSDEGDPGLACGLPGVTTRFIGTGNKAYSTLNMLEADVCALTTPGLDVLQIRRSPGVRHYTHIVHAVTDMAIYKLYSFDYFDSILCSGPHQACSIRALEELRGTGAKDLPECGCPYLDVMAARLEELRNAGTADAERKGKTRVLVAPTWGRNGLLALYGLNLLEPLARSGYELVIRPHPQSRIAEPELLRELAEGLAAFPNITWDAAPDGLAVMKDADVLVSDLSGIVFDFAFLLERPVLTLAFEPDLRGLEGNDLPWPAWELEVLDIVGRRISLEDLPRLPDIVREVREDPEFLPRLRALRAESVWNFRQAGPAIAEKLVALRDAARERLPVLH